MDFKKERIKISEIVSRFNCKQVQFLITPKLEIKQARLSHGLQKLSGEYGGYAQSATMFVLTHLILE